MIFDQNEIMALSGEGWDCFVSPGLTVASDEYVSALKELKGQEYERFLRFRDERIRREWLTARMLAVDVVATALGMPMSRIRLTQECPTCRGIDHGKPKAWVADRVAPVAVSWSHSCGYVAVAVGMNIEIGVDVECWGEYPPRELPLELLHPRDRKSVIQAQEPSKRFLEVWTEKEAIAKLTGWSLGHCLENSSVHLRSAGPRRIGVTPWTREEKELIVSVAIWD